MKHLIDYLDDNFVCSSYENDEKLLEELKRRGSPEDLALWDEIDFNYHFSADITTLYDVGHPVLFGIYGPVSAFNNYLNEFEGSGQIIAMETVESDFRRSLEDYKRFPTEYMSIALFSAIHGLKYLTCFKQSKPFKKIRLALMREAYVTLFTGRNEEQQKKLEKLISRTRPNIIHPSFIGADCGLYYAVKRNRM